MELPTHSRRLHQRIVVGVSEIVNTLLYALLLVGVAGVAVGIYQAAKHLVEGSIRRNSSHTLETLIIDMIIIVALIEVIRSVISYLSEGRVRVTLIIETVLIIMLNEIVRIQFEEKPDITTVYLLGVIVVLMALRILAIRFSPQQLIKAAKQVSSRKN